MMVALVALMLYISSSCEHEVRITVPKRINKRTIECFLVFMVIPPGLMVFPWYRVSLIIAL